MDSDVSIRRDSQEVDSWVAPDAGYEVDQVIDAIGHWGPWQTKMFFLVGAFMIPGTFQILILTFINADQVLY